jgi:16S rRNA processing protein RimM
MASGGADERLVVVGKIAGLYGVKGWVRVRSFTEPASNLIDYQPWHIGQGGKSSARRVEQARTHGAGLVARLEGIADREAARELIGAEISVARSRFPDASGHEYYWADLVGMQVKNTQGVVLGLVDHLISTGGNDVLVVKGERRRMVPFVMSETVRRVDLADRVIEVDWDADF